MSSQSISAAVRRRVAEMSQYRCGYCLTAQRIIGPLLEVDHIVPQARGGTDEADNLVLACPMCNSHKADRQEAVDPETLLVVRLYNPRTDVWQDHFAWIEDGAVIRGQTPTGRATVAALAMNHPDMVAARRLWVSAGWHPPVH